MSEACHELQEYIPDTHGHKLLLGHPDYLFNSHEVAGRRCRKLRMHVIQCKEMTQHQHSSCCTWGITARSTPAKTHNMQIASVQRAIT